MKGRDLMKIKETKFEVENPQYFADSIVRSRFVGCVYCGQVRLGNWIISFGLRGPSPQAFTPFRGGLGSLPGA